MSPFVVRVPIRQPSALEKLAAIQVALSAQLVAKIFTENSRADFYARLADTAHHAGLYARAAEFNQKAAQACGRAALMDAALLESLQ